MKRQKLDQEHNEADKTYYQKLDFSKGEYKPSSLSETLNEIQFQNLVKIDQEASYFKSAPTATPVTMMMEVRMWIQELSNIQLNT